MSNPHGELVIDTIAGLRKSIKSSVIRYVQCQYFSSNHPPEYGNALLETLSRV